MWYDWDLCNFHMLGKFASASHDDSQKSLRTLSILTTRKERLSFGIPIFYSKAILFVLKHGKSVLEGYILWRWRIDNEVIQFVQLGRHYQPSSDVQNCLPNVKHAIFGQALLEEGVCSHLWR
jgi:hypothetical protein